MIFENVTNILIPEGDVFSISAGGTLLWSKPSPGPGVELPPSNQIWYEATRQLINGLGSPTSHTFDSETGRGVLTYSSDITNSTVITANAFRNSYYLLKIWWPDCCQAWSGDCMQTNSLLTHIYAGSALAAVSDGTCNGGCNSLAHIELLNNTHYYPNTTGLVTTGASNKYLVLGTSVLDIRDTGCTIIASRCMADMNIAGKTLYFPSTVTAFTGDYNIGSSQSPAFTAYFYSVEAPTVSSSSNIRCGTGTTIHIPVGSLASYQSKWASLSGFSRMTFVEDL